MVGIAAVAVLVIALGESNIAKSNIVLIVHYSTVRHKAATVPLIVYSVLHC
jgi:hypothetical protein